MGLDQTSDRITRQSVDSTAPTKSPSPVNMDQTVQGILEWLQGKYAGARKGITLDSIIIITV